VLYPVDRIRASHIDLILRLLLGSRHDRTQP
jgi:hypothetical protein